MIVPRFSEKMCQETTLYARKLMLAVPLLLICTVSMGGESIGSIAQSKPAAQRVVPVSAFSAKPLKPSSDKDLAILLKRYQQPDEEFSWNIKTLQGGEQYDAFEVTFPSPYEDSAPENKTVWCEYFRSKSPGKRPAVIVLHGVFDGSFSIPRKCCTYLASSGIDALLVKLPFHGPRQARGQQGMGVLLRGVPGLISAIEQAVLDVRRADRFLREQEGVDSERTGILGMSLGAIIGALTVGVDGDIPRAVLVMGAGGLCDLIKDHARRIPLLAAQLKATRLDDEGLNRAFRPIDPLTYANRAKNTRILMVNAKRDRIVFPRNSRRLAKAMPHAEVVWMDTTHMSIITKMDVLLPKAVSFFLAR